jgi:hypothetical protein
MFYTAHRIFNLEEFIADKGLAATMPVIVNMAAIKWIEPHERLTKHDHTRSDDYCIVYFIGGGELVVYEHDIMRFACH